VHYRAQSLLDAFHGRSPRTRVEVREALTETLVDQVATGEIDVALGFCVRRRGDVRVSRVLDERAVLAVGADHPIAGREHVSLGALAEERFAFVDDADGSGYNEAVRSACLAAGFVPRTSPAPTGPMAWESAVTNHGCVGLTTRMASVSTLLGTVLVEVDPPVTLPVDVVWPHRRRSPSAMSDFLDAAAELRG
jgi:DNA-binding transcriptional LysR family regulator